MNGQDILNQAVQALGRVGTPVVQGAEHTIQDLINATLETGAAWGRIPGQISSQLNGKSPAEAINIMLHGDPNAPDAIPLSSSAQSGLNMIGMGFAGPETAGAMEGAKYLLGRGKNAVEDTASKAIQSTIDDLNVGRAQPGGLQAGFVDPNYSVKPPPGSFPEGATGDPIGLHNNIGNNLDTSVEDVAKQIVKNKPTPPSTGGEITPSTTKSVVNQTPSRFKTGEELVNYVDQKGSGSVGVQLNQTELNQLKEHVMSLNTPENAKWQGTIYKNYSGGKDIILGVVQDPASRGFAPNAYSNMYIATDGGYGLGKVRTHSTPINPKDIIGKVDITNGVPQLGSGGEIPKGVK